MDKKLTKIERAILLLVENGYAVHRVLADPLRAAPVDPATTRRNYTIREFCETYRVSRTLFYKMQKEGRGPALMKIGRRAVISQEAAHEWAQSMEINHE